MAKNLTRWLQNAHHLWRSKAQHTNKDVGDGNIIVWGYFSAYGIGTLYVTEGRLNGKMHRDTVDKSLLKKN